VGSEEFSRVLGFRDGVFAIAMTLRRRYRDPTLSDGGDVGQLADALNDRVANFVGFSSASP